MKLPILALAAAGFAVVTTEFVIIGVLPQLADDLGLGHHRIHVKALV